MAARFCAEYTHKLPGHVFAEFFNLSTDLALRIKEVSVLYDRAVQRKEDELQKAMSLELYRIAEDIIAQRRANPLDPREDPNLRRCLSPPTTRAISCPTICCWAPCVS